MQEEKKKILFSAYSLDIGGIENALVSLINYLSKEYDVTLVLEKKQGAFLNQVNDDVEIVEYKPFNLKIKWIDKILNECKRIKFKRKYNNKFQFACSYATYCKTSSVVAQIASKNNALWVHNNYYQLFDRNDYKYKEFFDSINAHKFKNVIFVSEETKEQYIEKYGIQSENVLKCNNLIDYEKVIKLSEEKSEIKRDDSVVTFVNISKHNEHQKRITRLIECAKLLEKDGLKYRILLVGEGKETENYKKIINNSGLNKRIIFTGKTTNPYPYFKIADCIILTSDYEGYPVAYIESKILNKPIITTDVSDSNIDIKGKFGVVTEKRINDIYMAMKNFIIKGYEIKETFNPEAFNEEIIQKIENIINQVD